MESKYLTVEQQYTQEMMQYFNPLQVVASILSKVDFNPYTMKALDVRFVLGDEDVYYNRVQIRIEFIYFMPGDWVDYFKDSLQRIMKDGFTMAYGKKADKKYNDCFGIKDPMWFNKEFDNEIAPNKY
jgi:hypothetical protein